MREVKGNMGLFSIIREQLTSSTSHAIPNIFRTTSWTIRIFWTVAFLFASALCSYMIFQSVNDFLQYDVNTKTRSFREYPVIFPAVVICNKDPFITEKSMTLLANEIKDNSAIFENFRYSKETDLELIKKFILQEEDDNLIVLKNFAIRQSIKDNITDIGYEYDDFFLNCSFDQNSCSQTDFDPFIDTENGMCFKFNHIAPFRNLTKIGIKHGLEISLLVGKSKKFLSLSQSAGAVIYIYNQTFFHSEEDRIELNPGTSTSIVLGKSLISAQPLPYSDCVVSPLDSLNANLKSQFSKNKISYKMKICFDSCLQSEIFQRCSCFSYDLQDVLDDHKTCELKNETDCETSILLNEAIQGSCLNQCPRACESQKYSFKMFNSLYPTETARLKITDDSSEIEILNSNCSLLDKSVLNFIIYIDDYYYQYISESPAMSLSSLIANIGGTLGLFLGLSVLSFFELFEIMFEILFFLLQKKDKIKKIEDINC